MNEPVRYTAQMPSTRSQASPPSSSNGGGGGGTDLADILERVLDKGIVIAGDIQINLLDIELLTIKIRLIVASVDRAKEMGIDWWERDPTLSSGHTELEEENRRLRERLERLENGQAAVGRGRQDEEDEPDERDVDEDGLEDGEIEDGELEDGEPEDAEPEDAEPEDRDEAAPEPARRPRSGRRGAR